MASLSASDVRPFIPAKDFSVSKRFYAALGWETRDVGPSLALVRVSDGQYFYLQDFYVQAFAENSMLHITVDDAESWHKRVSAVVAQESFSLARVGAPTRQDYGAIVTFVHDPAGVLLHLCQWDVKPV